MKIQLWVFACLGLAITADCAYSQNADTLAHKDKINPSFTWSLNNRGTLMYGERISIYGIQFGIKYNKRLRHHVTLNSTIFGRNEHRWLPANMQHLHYFGFSEDFLIKEYGRWEYRSFLHFGWGRAYTAPDIQSISGQWKLGSTVMPLELGVHASYKIKDWLRFKTGVGYRHVFLYEGQGLNSPYYKLGFAIQSNEVFQYLKKQKKFSKHESESI